MDESERGFAKVWRSQTLGVRSASAPRCCLDWMRSNCKTLLQIVREAKRVLILSDCEGFERFLFPSEAGAELVRHEVVQMSNNRHFQHQRRRELRPSSRPLSASRQNRAQHRLVSAPVDHCIMPCQGGHPSFCSFSSRALASNSPCWHDPIWLAMTDFTMQTSA